MDPALQKLIDKIVGDYAPAPREQVKVSMTPDPEKKPAPKKDAPVRAPTQNAAPKMGLATRGTYDAEEFLRRINTPESRLPTGRSRLIHEQDAISGFCGYDTRVPHGRQLDTARAEAFRLRSPIKGAEYKRSPIPATVRGYVAGMPDPDARRRQLLAWEQECVSRILDAQKRAETLSPSARAEAEATVKFEALRLDQIRKDLKAL
jgi:hypothetical protein